MKLIKLIQSETKFVYALPKYNQQISFFHTATSVKKQVCDITHMIQLSIRQMVTLFYTDEKQQDSKSNIL